MYIQVVFFQIFLNLENLDLFKLVIRHYENMVKHHYQQLGSALFWCLYRWELNYTMALLPSRDSSS